jgi:hypothetical protein
MSLGRYSVKDWKGYVAMPQGEGIEAPKLENYIQVICRLYRKDAAVQGVCGHQTLVSGCQGRHEKAFSLRREPSAALRLTSASDMLTCPFDQQRGANLQCLCNSP